MKSTFGRIALVALIAIGFAAGVCAAADFANPGLNLAAQLMSPADALPYGLMFGMTTLAANTPRAYELGDRNAFPVIGSDIIFEGAAVGLVAGTGHARPLASGDRFAGFAEAKADNSAGAAAAINVRTIANGLIELAVTGAVITDVGQPVYATDDNAFSMVSGGIFIGRVHRFVSTGVAVVAFEASLTTDPYGVTGQSVTETVAINKTLDAGDTGTTQIITADATVTTLPAIADGLSGVKIVNGGAFGTIAVTISPNAADMIMGPGITGADNKDLINTKATARRGDYVVLEGGDADGYVVTEMVGIWAREA